MTQQLAVSYSTERVRVPASIVAGLFSSTLTPLAPADQIPVTVTSDAPTLVFDNVADGDYTITHARLDSTGQPIGRTLNEILNIVAGVVTVSLLLDGVAAASYSATVIPEAPEPSA